MEDASSHVATRRDDVHTISLSELEMQILQAGIVMSRRQLTRHCKSGTFDAIKLPAVNNIENWYIAPSSIDKGIADIKALRALRDSHVATRRDMTGHVDTQVTVEEGGKIGLVMSGHDATRRDSSDQEASHHESKTRPDAPRHVETQSEPLDIFEHPYVRRLEGQVEKWEGKYHDQVRRTEEIQMGNQKALIELQRLTAVGQSQTLADFMLRAKEWIVGDGSGTPEKPATSDGLAA